MRVHLIAVPEFARMALDAGEFHDRPAEGEGSCAGVFWHLRTRVSRLGDVFAGDRAIASTVFDRLLHWSHVINVRGEGYRPKQKRQAGLFIHSFAPISEGR